MKIVLVRQGEVYGPEYVSILQMQGRKTTPETEFVTLTDQADTPGPTRRLRHNLKGWWAKLELFAPENYDLRPFLYIDLDSFIFGDLRQYEESQFTMVKDFTDWVPANSSVMWIPKDTDHIWKNFTKDEMAKAGGRGDQYYLGQFAQKLWTTDDGIVSYRMHGCGGPCGNIMQFHGRPKQPDAKGWAQDLWNSLQSSKS